MIKDGIKNLRKNGGMMDRGEIILREEEKCGG